MRYVKNVRSAYPSNVSPTVDLRVVTLEGSSTPSSGPVSSPRLPDHPRRQGPTNAQQNKYCRAARAVAAVPVQNNHATSTAFIELTYTWECSKDIFGRLELETD